MLFFDLKKQVISFNKGAVRQKSLETAKFDMLSWVVKIYNFNIICKFEGIYLYNVTLIIFNFIN